MKTKNILFATGLIATAFQSNAQFSTVIGTTKNPIKIEIERRSPLCHGDQNGKIYFTIGGGVAPYKVNNQPIDNNVFEISGLGAGNYHFDITDNSSTSASADVILVDPSDLQVTSMVNNVSTFHGSDGSIKLDVNEINPTFIWEGISLNNNGNLIVTYEDQTGLSAGHYGVTITNEIGCSTYRKFEVTQPNPPVVSNPQILDGVGLPMGTNISVFPNPSSGHVTLRADATVRSAVITNDLGIVLKSLNFKNDGTLAGLDLNPGVYTLISIDEQGNRATERIVIQ